MILGLLSRIRLQTMSSVIIEIDLRRVPGGKMGQAVNKTSDFEQMVNNNVEQRLIPRSPIKWADDKSVSLNTLVCPLIFQAIQGYCSRWIPGGSLVYVDGGSEVREHFDQILSNELGASVGIQERLPDLVVYDKRRGWLFLIESASSHGPIDQQRHDELKVMFGNCRVHIALVTVFENRNEMSKHLDSIAWGTTAWVADSPTHSIHFDGALLPGPSAYGNRTPE